MPLRFPPRPRRRTPAFRGAFLLLALAACSSPNRGIWEGTFDGSVSGVVRFEINARGTALTGTLEGTTSGGQPFRADMEGRLRGEHFYATFAGKGRAGLLPVRFEGLMRGTLANGAGSGDWTAEIKPRQSGSMRGGWGVRQVEGPAERL